MSESSNGELFPNLHRLKFINSMAMMLLTAIKKDLIIQSHDI